jgi:hypothetical protein
MHTTGFFLQVDYLELKKLLAAGRLEDRKPRRIMPSSSDVAHVRLGLIDHSGPAHAFAHLCQYRAKFRDRNFFLRPLFPLRSKMNSPAVDRYQARTNGEPEGYQSTFGRIEGFLLPNRHKFSMRPETYDGRAKSSWSCRPAAVSWTSRFQAVLKTNTDAKEMTLPCRSRKAYLGG